MPTGHPAPADPQSPVPSSLTPEDQSSYRLFSASAENLVTATDVLDEFLRDLEHVGDQATQPSSGS